MLFKLLMVESIKFQSKAAKLLSLFYELLDKGLILEEEQSFMKSKYHTNALYISAKKPH